MSDSQTHTTPRAAFERYLRANSLRCTQERLAVADAAAAACGMFTAEELHASLEAKGTRVSMATVYNTLHTLTEAAMVLTHNFDSAVTRFEYIKPAASPTRLHLICISCGRVRETKDPELTKTIGSRKHSSFLISHCAVYLYGLCGRCRRKSRTRAITGNTANKTK